MKKQAISKLCLNTETVMRLDAAQLDDVNGGFTPAGAILFNASVRFCAAASAAALRSAQHSCICRR